MFDLSLTPAQIELLLSMITAELETTSITDNRVQILTDLLDVVLPAAALALNEPALVPMDLL